MSRTRPWMVVLLVAVTGLVAGFARLDSVRRASPPRRASSTSPVDDVRKTDDETLRYYLDELRRYLAEAETVSVPPMTLPPLDQLPPLPAELLPEETTADLSAEPS